MRSPTWLLIKDELWGFAKSKVMLVLWVILPAIAILGYFLLPSTKMIKGSMSNELTVTAFMALLMSSIAGTVAALMVAVDLVSEKNRNVYVLYVIRPIRRDAIIFAKFVAVFACVTIACIVSIGLGIAVDAVRGEMISGDQLYDLVKSLTSLVAVIALATAIGVCFGVISKSILVAVILVLYVGQNVAVIPMLPMYFGILPNHFWLFMLFSAVLVGVVLGISALLFRRQEF